MNDMAQDLARLASDGAEPAQVPEPTVLRNLRVAGLASHVARGAASGAGGEPGVLRALCGLVAGPVYRLDPFHYAFCLRPDDVGGGLKDLAPAQWAGALETVLRRVGVGLEVRSLAPPPEAERAAAGEGPAAGGFATEAPVWLLRAWDAAAEPGVQAVINAHFAAATARLTAELVTADRPADPAEAASAEAAPAGAVPDAPQAVGEAAPREAAEELPAPVPQGAQAEAAPEAAEAEAAPLRAPAQDGPDVAALERRLAALEALLRG